MSWTLRRERALLAAAALSQAVIRAMGMEEGGHVKEGEEGEGREKRGVHAHSRTDMHG